MTTSPIVAASIGAAASTAMVAFQVAFDDVTAPE